MPPATASPYETARRRASMAPRKPANASASQSVKWISERNSAPYSMNGK